MKLTKKILSYILHTAAFILALASVLSLFRNSTFRYLKMFDFPRIQFFILSLVVLILMGLILKKWKLHSKILGILLTLGLIINGIYLINYTVLVPVEVPSAIESHQKNDQFSILIINVKMTNRRSEKIVKMLKDKQPDIFLAMETDAWWDRVFLFLKKEYPYSQRTINPKTYGMILYSKFPLQHTHVDYLNNDHVPSFRTQLLLDNRKTVNFHAVHPVPPNYFEDLPDNEGQKAKALEKIGAQIQNSALPVMVAGDLNDVVWSHIDDLTNTKEVLFDVRVGRGFYNSFNAENFLMRWPLDHLFVSKEFQLHKLERLEKIGSDHFPIYAELVLENH